MSDDRTLKPVFGQTDELYSFCVIYETDSGLYGMYVWGKNIDDAKTELRKQVSGANIKEVKIEWPR